MQRVLKPFGRQLAKLGSQKNLAYQREKRSSGEENGVLGAEAPHTVISRVAVH